MKLTPAQVKTLKWLDAGKQPHCSPRLLASLRRNGLAKLYVPIGWVITGPGRSALRSHCERVEEERVEKLTTRGAQ